MRLWACDGSTIPCGLSIAAVFDAAIVATAGTHAYHEMALDNLAASFRRLCAWLILSLASASCSGSGIDVVFYIHDGYTFSRAERRTIETIAKRAALDARRLLPGLPDHLILRVNPGKKVMAETGQTGEVSPPNVVYWMVDPDLYGGVMAIAKRQLHSTLLHEFHHLVREIKTTNSGSIMDQVIDEGLATAFERDFGDAPPPPWGTYPPEVASWVKELSALPPDASRTIWMSRHPDGRRWAGYKAGTYVVDRAMRATGKSAPELLSASTDEILEMAFHEQTP